VGAYDSSLPLVIDPVLSFATYVGGSGDDYGDRIAVDKDGNIYVTGETESTNLPTISPFQATFGGEFDAFVIKLNAAGNMLIYSTYLGGSKTEYGNGIAVDASGSAYITGHTKSDDFPTKNAVYGKYSFPDGFVTKLNPAGNALVYSTYYGGDMPGSFCDIALDAIGNVYVVGDLTVLNPPGRTYMVGKLDATGSRSIFLRQFSAIYSYGKAITVDTSGNIYIAIYDDWDNNCFIMKLNPNGIQVFAKSLSGSGDDECNDITLDSTGNIYVAGRTNSTDFPTKNPIQATNGGGFDAFVTKFNASGTRIFSTYLGGSGTDVGIGIASDNNGNAYISGYTSSSNFPTANPMQAVIGGKADAFVAKLNTATSQLVYSTYLGGSDSDFGGGIAIDTSENVYVTGYTSSADFPLANPLQSTNAGGVDIFIAKIANTPSLVKNNQDQLPTSFALEQNYPNPFNPETEIRFQLREASHVVVKIFNTTGQEIRILTDSQYEAGYHNVRWNGKG
jgi:hypothetical protein